MIESNPARCYAKIPSCASAAQMSSKGRRYSYRSQTVYSCCFTANYHRRVPAAEATGIVTATPIINKEIITAAAAAAVAAIS